MINSKRNFNSLDGKVRHAFSKAALKYDSLTDLHRKVASKLVDGLELEKRYFSILDVGMGTGWLTKSVKAKFPNAQVVGLDFADGMIDYAKQNALGLNFILADARELPFKKESFDLVISNLAYQWVDDLSKAFSLCHKVLMSDGTFEFSLFGEATFSELFDSLDEALILSRQKGKKLANRETVFKALCSAGFRNIELERELIKLKFNDMISLVRWLKNIGANRLNSGIYVGKTSFLRASNFYQEHFQEEQGIYATFEIISGRCNK